MIIKITIKTSGRFFSLTLDLEYTNEKEVFSAIVFKLSEYGFYNIEDKLYAKDGTKLNVRNIMQFVEDGTLNVTYKDIVAPYVEAEYHRENGLIFYFNSNENNHLHTPHIHVNYNDENIFVYLNKNKKNDKIEYIGNFKNRSVLKRALKFIEENYVLILEKWYDIHKNK